MTDKKENLDNDLKIVEFKNQYFSLKLTTRWKATKLSDTRIVFNGPLVGKKHISLFVTWLEKKGMTVLEVAKKAKKLQEANTEDYKILEEVDLSKNNHKAFMRRACYFDTEQNMVVILREIFTEKDDKIFIISSSIPNAKALKEIDQAMVSTMNSFRFIE